MKESPSQDENPCGLFLLNEIPFHWQARKQIGDNHTKVRLDAVVELFYLAAMTDFYHSFAHQPGDGRDRPPEVSEILPALLVGEYPRIEDIAWLKQHFGISAVMSLQDAGDLTAKNLSLSALTDEYRRHEIAFHHAPVADFDCDSLAAALPATLNAMQALMQASHRIFLHCNAGCNRAPTLAIAYLHAYHDMSLLEARDFVKARRPCGPYMEVLYQYFGRPSTDD
jgi:protein-tyrosine phosphatase